MEEGVKPRDFRHGIEALLEVFSDISYVIALSIVLEEVF
jgi:hypothetical protein